MQTPTHQQRWTTLLLAVATLGFTLIVWPFAGAIFWSLVLAIVFDPLNRRLLVCFKQRKTAAALATLSIAVAGVGIPVTVVGALVVRQAVALYWTTASGRFDLGDTVGRAVALLPAWALSAFDRLGIAEPGALEARFSAIAIEVSRFVATHLLRLGMDSLDFALSVAVMLYLLYFFLRDGRTLAARIEWAIPLAAPEKASLLITFVGAIRATVKGGAVMAIVQGTLGGLLLNALGVPAALLWGVVFGMASMLPAIGAGVLWLPIAFFFLLTGAYVKALVLTLFGSIVLTLIDNLLRPLLVGHATHLPGYLIFLSTLGGVASLGLSGVVIGPVVAAMFVAAWGLFSSEATSQPPPPTVAGS